MDKTNAGDFHACHPHYHSDTMTPLTELSALHKQLSTSFKLFGFLDVKNIPCARESVLYGSLGGLVMGLGHFLATSRVKRSCDVAVGSYICTMLGYWFYCRYNLAQQRIRQRMLKEGMKNRILFEGSYLDPEKKQTGSERSNS